jgi:hypothetical protein
LLSSEGIVIVNLELRRSSGEVASRNLYWLGADNASYRRLNRLPPASLSVVAKSTRVGEHIRVQVELRNTGNAISLANKLTLLNAGDASRILPAYYSDNYLSWLPGESREMEIEYSVASANGPAELGLRGWNLARQVVPVP